MGAAPLIARPPRISLMMADELDELLSEDAFWDEIDDIASTPCRSHDRIDDTLRTWIEITTRHREEHLKIEDDFSRCANRLLEGSLFARHADYVRRQLVYVLLQEDDPPTIHLISAFLLLDGRQHETSLDLLSKEGGFPRLVDLIRHGTDDDSGLHRRLLMLLYEMSRIQRISWNDLVTVDDSFILYLFHVIESLSGDVNDPYHYPVIQVLLVLNEQYMVSAHTSGESDSDGQSITNRVIKVLSTHGGIYKTFGENIILLLNRESETSLQLLILKLFFLLFTTPQTQEYFYTNDLHVLVDILIRNLLDLPPDSVSTPTTSSLRHTYLRVLHPLLAYTQLAQPPYYKRDELRKMLLSLAGAGYSQLHFERPDETTLRLVGRCLGVEWLRDGGQVVAGDETASTPSAPQSPVEEGVGSGQAMVAKRLIGMGMSLSAEAQDSSLSVNEVARQQAKPGVATPSRFKGQAVTGESSAELVTPSSLLASPTSESDPFDD